MTSNSIYLLYDTGYNSITTKYYGDAYSKHYGKIQCHILVLTNGSGFVHSDKKYVDTINRYLLQP